MLLTPTRWLKCCVLALLLFAQAASALDACVSVKVKAGDAFVVMPPDCDMSPVQANLCLMQCLSGDQTDGDVRILLPPPPDVAVLRLPRDAVRITPGGLLASRPPRLCTGPPLSQLCRLLL